MKTIHPARNFPREEALAAFAELKSKVSAMTFAADTPSKVNHSYAVLSGFERERIKRQAKRADNPN